MLLIKTKIATSQIPEAGKGLYAAEPVAKGTAIYRFDLATDQLITEKEICKLPTEKQNYIRSHGRYSEEAKIWALDTDDAVYINHSEYPTLRGRGGPLGEFVAAFDLPAGTELTISYPEICDMSRKTGLIDTSRTLGGEKQTKLHDNPRNLQQAEWKLLRSLRLKALECDPQSFWESLEDAQRYDDTYWQNLTFDLTKPGGSRMFLLETNQEIVGFVYGIKKDDEEYRIGGLWVDPKRRRQSYGNSLVQAVISWAKNCSAKAVIKLWSPTGSTVHFYERNGFRSLGNIKTHTQDKRQIVEMEYR